jgi:hypothetical protein
MNFIRVVFTSIERKMKPDDKPMRKISNGIKSWPAEDRPREKLLKCGAEVLSNSELLAILLRTGVLLTSSELSAT